MVSPGDRILRLSAMKPFALARVSTQMRHPSPARSTVSEAAGRDSDIVAMLAAGDAERAFEGLVARYEVKVLNLCRSLLRDAPAARDAAQDSFLRIWRAL